MGGFFGFFLELFLSDVVMPDFEQLRHPLRMRVMLAGALLMQSFLIGLGCFVFYLGVTYEHVSLALFGGIIVGFFLWVLKRTVLRFKQFCRKRQAMLSLMNDSKPPYSEDK